MIILKNNTGSVYFVGKAAKLTISTNAIASTDTKSSNKLMPVMATSNTVIGVSTQP